MYSIKNTQDIKFNYTNTSIRKISERQYQYHGKPNEPNLVLMNGIKRISYVAEMIEVKPGNPSELIIHHIATSNFPKKAIVKVPLVVSNNTESSINKLLDMETNDVMDLDISSDISDYTMEINEADKNAYVIRFMNALPISKKITSKKPRRKIVEGNCGLSTTQLSELKIATQHAKNKGTHKHDFSNDINTAIKTWIDNNPDKLQAAAGGNSETTNLINSLSNGTGEMECFPNEGKVFNKKFHIYYDDNDSYEFINGSERFDPENTVEDKFKPHKDAINEAVNELKEDIKRLGGIYVEQNDLTDPNESSSIELVIGNDDNDEKNFFNANTDIDIFITYKKSSKGKLRKLDENGKPKDAVTQVRQVRDAIFVSYNNSGTPIPMNATKFAKDYLSKDYSRYTHVSINGYLTGSQNQTISYLMTLIVSILGITVLYFTVPSIYKTAIRKITKDNRTCDKENDFYNYRLVAGFNYWFVLGFILIPGIIHFIAPNFFTMILPVIGVLLILIMKARWKFDNTFFYSFYPKDGLRSCNKTSDYTDDYINTLYVGLTAWKKIFT